MDYRQELVLCQMKIFYLFKYLSDICIWPLIFLSEVQTCIDVYILSAKIDCNFNVFSTKLTHMLNILDKFSMSVTMDMHQFLEPYK